MVLMSDAPKSPPSSPFGTYARTTPDSVAMAEEGPPQPGVARSQRLVSDGVERRFVLYVPKTHDGVTPLPLVLNLHGSTSYPEEQLMLSDFTAAADRHGVAVLAPEGLQRLWNAPHDATRVDDAAFIARAIDRASDLVALDASSCYATGFSGGARMLAPLVSRLPQELRAIAPVSVIRFPTDCPSQRRPAVLAFHGGLDKVNPYQGGGLAYWQTGVEHEVQAWARPNGVLHDTQEEHTDNGVTHTVFGQGPHRVELYRIQKLGHIWAGHPTPLGELFDPPNTAVSATEQMLAAFTALA